MIQGQLKQPYVKQKNADLGIRLARLTYIDEFGQAHHIEEPRDTINTYKTKLYKRKTEINEMNKANLEKKKSLSLVAKEGLKQDDIPVLYVRERTNNITSFIEITYKRYMSINNNSPMHLNALIDTI